MKKRSNVRLISLVLAVACIFLSGQPLGMADYAAADGLRVDAPGHLRNLAPASGLPISPAYDSGWYEVGIRPDPLPVDFTHNLGGDPDDYLVNLMCRDDTSLATYNCSDFGFTPDAHWYGLTDSTISVWVSSGAKPDAIRVLIYSVTPSYDSGWYSLLSRPDPIPVEFTHNLGGDQDDYVVSLECRDETSLAIYNCTDFSFDINADWYGLNDTSITIWVDNGPRPDEIRVRILEAAPDFDSGWINLLIRPDPVPVIVNHFLGGDPDNYLVSLTCRDNSSLATFACTSFLFNQHAGWYALGPTSLNVWVESGTDTRRCADTNLDAGFSLSANCREGLKNQLKIYPKVNLSDPKGCLGIRTHAACLRCTYPFPCSH